jgi:hypothetical protein
VSRLCLRRPCDDETLPGAIVFGAPGSLVGIVFPAVGRRSRGSHGRGLELEERVIGDEWVWGWSRGRLELAKQLAAVGRFNRVRVRPYRLSGLSGVSWAEWWGLWDWWGGLRELSEAQLNRVAQ